MTPTQLRMARSALHMTMRDMAEVLGCTAAAVCGYEKGDESKLGRVTLAEAEQYFTSHRVFFGPKDGVCVGADVFEQERWYASALFQLLKEGGGVPSSTELLAAGERAKDITSNGQGQPGRD